MHAVTATRHAALPRPPHTRNVMHNNNNDDVADDGSGDDVLTRQHMAHALSQLQHSRDGELVYTHCTLSRRGVRDIAALASFVHLQHLTLDHNALTSLAPLQSLHSLVWLSATHNALGDDVFAHLQHSASTLEYVCLDHNRITSLAGLSKTAHVRELHVAHNALTQLRVREVAVAFATLQRLSVAHNHITAVVDEDDEAAEADDTAARTRTAAAAAAAVTPCCLHTIDLSYNALDSAHARMGRLCARVEVLQLRGNALTRLRGTGVARARALVCLDVSHNALDTLDELHVLQHSDDNDNGRCGMDSTTTVATLRTLHIDGNPCMQHSPQPLVRRQQQQVQLEQQQRMLSTPLRKQTRSATARSDASGVDVVSLSTATVSGAVRGVVPPHALRTAPLTTTATTMMTTRQGDGSAAVDNDDDDDVVWRHTYADELARLSVHEQCTLYVLHVLPHLLQLHDVRVTPALVARAHALYTSLDADEAVM